MKIIYLLGAGASYNSIPTIKETGNRDSFVDYIESTLQAFVDGKFYFEKYKNDKRFDRLRNFMSSEGKEIAHYFQKYQTPDTFARSLYLSTKIKDKIYYDLKVVLCLFFLLWKEHKRYLFRSLSGDITAPNEYFDKEFLFSKNDNRYTSFFASILEQGKGKPIFPKNLKILSWNYDSEIEETLSEYFLNSNMNLKNVQDHFVISNFSDNVNLLDSNIIHLNGTYADLIDLTGKSIIDYANNSDFDFSSTLYLFDQLIFGTMERSSLQFSWDNEKLKDLFKMKVDLFNINNQMKNFGNLLGNAERLIIIGYSFPIFNREMDGFMLREFLGDRPENKVIHIQNTEYSMDGIKQRIRALTGNYGKLNFQEHFGLDEFYIPFEFD